MKGQRVPTKTSVSPKLWRQARGTHSGHPISSGNNYICFQIYKYGSPSRPLTWSRATGKVKPWRQTRSRNLYLKQRIQYVHSFLLSKIWHIAQIFPDPEGAGAATRNGNIHVWRDAVFRVPLSTLQRRTEDRGMELIDFVAQCRVLFLIRFRTQGDRSVSLTAE